MPNKSKFDHLTYFETSTAQEYTSKPQGALDAGRLAQGRTDCWQKLTPAGNVKKKDLILADWWAENWDPLMCSRVKVLLAELLGEGFKLYVWQDPDLKLLDDINLLDNKKWREQIKPEFKDVLTAQAMAQLKLPNDKLAILQRTELQGLLGRTPDESKTINALYLANTTHSIEKIKAVEASESTTFEKALLGEVSTYYYDPGYKTQEIKDKLKQNWKDVELTENYHALRLSDDSKIYLNENGNVSVDKLSKAIDIDEMVRRVSRVRMGGRPEYDEPLPYKTINKVTHELANSPSHLSLNLKALDSDHPASVLEQLLTTELKGLEIINYPFADTPLNINPENLANLEYLALSASCPPGIVLSIIKSSRLSNLIIDMGNYQLPEGLKIADISNADDQSLSQLKCLTLTNCNSKALELMLYHEMPELNSLVLFGALNQPFESPHSLDKLKSLTISGAFDAQCLESLTQSAVNCNRLDLGGAHLTGAFSPGFHLPKVGALTLGGLNDEHPEACAAAQTILKAISALTTLKIIGDISGYSFMDSVRIPQVGSLTLDGSDAINAQTLRPVLRGITDLNELTIENCGAYQWDEELSSLLSNIGKIQISFNFSSGIKSIDQVQDMPRLESIELGIQIYSDPLIVKSIDNLFKSASELKALSIDDFSSAFNFIHNVSLPDTVESLNLSSHYISAENLKKMLLAMPKLRFLTISGTQYNESNFKEWLADTELQDLLGNIEKVSLPHTYYKHVEYSAKINSEEGYITYESEVDSKRKKTLLLPPTRDPSTSSFMDADTTPKPDKSFDLARIFYSTSGDKHPSPSCYRLGTYNHVSLSEKTGIEQPFILKNTGDLDLTTCDKLIHVDDVFKLEKKITNGGYFGKQTFRLDSKWQPIASLSTMDHISHFHISGDNINLSQGVSQGRSVTPILISSIGNYKDYEINYSKRDNLYYIRSKTVAQTVTLDFLVQSTPGQPPVIKNPEVQEWTNTFRAFGEGELKLTSKNPTSQEYLDALIEQKVGPCRHRSVAFKALMAQKFPDLQVRIVENDCHMFVEIMQGSQWVRCDLGGYPAKMNIKEMTLDQDQKPTKSKITHTEMRYVSEQQRGFERNFETWAIGRDPRADNAKLYVEGVLNGQHKKQLIHVPADDIAALNIAIQTQAIHTSHPVFYIHSPDDLVCSAPFVMRDGNQGKLCSNPDGGGPLHDFLTASRDNTAKSPILIVNYARFSADDIVRFNGLLDEARLADGTPLPEDAVVIGLIDPDKPGAYNGADFYSRFDTVEQCPLTTIPPMILVLNTLTEQNKPTSEPVQINLCHASNWMTQLMGSWTLQHGELYFEEGKLVSALKSRRPIEIQNPPADSAFDIFWQQARLRKSIQYAGVSYPFPETVQCFSREGYDWHEVQNRISWAENTPSNALVLNPGNLSEFSVQYQFDQDGLFTRATGLLAEHSAKNPDSPLHILVTRSLSQDEWGLLLNEAEQYKTLELSISCSPGVTLPDALGHQLSSEVAPIPAWDKTLHPQTTCIVSDDPDLAIAGITKLQPDCIVLNISECTASDLLKRINGKLETLDLVFSETEQALLTSLNEGKKVVLTGTFSDELLDGLAPFIRQRANTPGAPGQLILVSQKPIGFMDAVSHQATLAEKRTALMGQGFSEANLARLEQENPSWITTQSFTTLSTRLHFQRAHPDKTSQHAWDGLSALRPSVLISEFNPSTSEKDAKGYLDARLTAFNQAIQDEPYVFLAGLTGVGKSRFVENELGDRTMFHGETSIQAWINASQDKKPTLFLDEANLSTRQWSELEGLFNTPPGLLIDGKYHPLTEHHKVIFAGNPLSYGDERKLAPLFARHGNSIVFEPLSNAFIYEKTLKPILKEQFDQKDYELVAKELLRAYDFLIGISRDEVLISPRQIQMMALAVIDYHVQFPKADIQTIAKFQARHMAYNLVPRQHLERFNQEFPAIDRTELLKDHDHSKPAFNKFLATPSRDMALWQLTDFLSLRTFQRETEINNFALRLGGLHRFVIEGEPGIGKSEMVIELMAGMGLHELRLGDTPAAEKKNGFYRLSASMQPGVQEAILLKAFDNGAIVLIDEINSMPTLEKMLNSLLDGKHPKNDNRPPLNPGFRVLGTQNPPTMAGRRLASPALENRTQTVRLLPYPEKEMHTILEKMGVASVTTRTELIEAFQSKVKEAKVRHLTPAPSFRNFIHMTKQLVEGHAKVVETPVYTKKISNVVKTEEPDDALRQARAVKIQRAFKEELQRMKPDESVEPTARKV